MSILLLRLGVGVAIAVGGMLAVWLSMRSRNESYEYSAPQAPCSNPICCTCLENLNGRWENVTLDCNHVLHKKCAELLFTQMINKCPLCRATISENFMKKNF